MRNTSTVLQLSGYWTQPTTVQVPEDYALLKDAVLDIWPIAHNGAIINRYRDRPLRFEDEIEAREQYWVCSLAKGGDAL